MIIKWVGFRLRHLVEYPTSTRHESDTITRIDTPTLYIDHIHNASYTCACDQYNIKLKLFDF